MPNYTFRNKETQEEYTLTLSMSDREKYLADNPNVEQLIVSTIPQLDPYNAGRMKVPSDFNNLMKRIKNNNYGSTIQTGNLTEI
jgi:hypothetical protein